MSPLPTPSSIYAQGHFTFTSTFQRQSMHQPPAPTFPLCHLPAQQEWEENLEEQQVEHPDPGSHAISCLTPPGSPLLACSQEWERGFQEQLAATDTCMCCPRPPIAFKIVLRSKKTHATTLHLPPPILQEWEKGFQEQQVATDTCMCCPWPPTDFKLLLHNTRNRLKTRSLPPPAKRGWEKGFKEH